MIKEEIKMAIVTYTEESTVSVSKVYILQILSVFSNPYTLT